MRGWVELLAEVGQADTDTDLALSLPTKWNPLHSFEDHESIRDLRSPH